MPDDPTTDYENAPLDTETWEIALKPYAKHPNAALDLARELITIKALLERQPPDTREAIAVLDEAANVLFPLTEFHSGAYDLFRTYIEGRATRAHEALIESLGVKF